MYAAITPCYNFCFLVVVDNYQNVFLEEIGKHINKLNVDIILKEQFVSMLHTLFLERNATFLIPFPLVTLGQGLLLRVMNLPRDH